VKKAILQIFLIMLFTPLILAQTTHRYLENFDSGNAEGWVFYTDASVSVQNGQLHIQSTSPGFQSVLIGPPLGATVNDFSIEYASETATGPTGGFVGRVGFNSAIGALYEDDSVRVVYTTDLSSSPPNFVTLYTRKITELDIRAKIEVTRSGADLGIKFTLRDTLRFTGNLVNAPPELMKGHLMMSIFGDNINFSLSMVDIKYIPYIADQSTSYFESFNDPATPWYKYHPQAQPNASLTISNGNLNMNYTGSEYVSLMAATPVGSVGDFEFAGSYILTNPSGFFGMYRIYSERYYAGVMYEGDTLSLIYQDGGTGEPKLITQAAANLNLYTSLRLTAQRTGNNIVFRVYGNSIQLLSGTLVTSDSRLYYGHLLMGFDTEDNLSVSFPDATIAFTRFVTGVEEEPIPPGYGLSQNFPNPFNPETVIRYSMPVSGEVVINVYDLLGQKVKTLVNGYQEAGEHEIQFEANDLPGGVYLYELRSGTYITARKMVLLK